MKFWINVSGSTSNVAGPTIQKMPKKASTKPGSQQKVYTKSKYGISKLQPVKYLA
ncbi:hypothetical protein D3C74_325120 [compost metagenome]